jgi:hypothetical protein
MHVLLKAFESFSEGSDESDPKRPTKVPAANQLEP